MTERYLQYLASVRRYSARTLELYREVLDEFMAHAGGAPLSPAAVRNYEVWLLDTKGESPRTVNMHLSVLSGYCKYLMKNGLLEANPVKLVSRPKSESRLPVFYRKEAMDAYFKQTQNYVDTEDLGMKERYEARLRRLIVSLLYNTGIRRSELVGLTLGSVDSARGVLRVRGKGDKMREIPLIPALCQEISLYLHSVETMVGGERTAADPLLVTLKGGKLYPVYVDRAVKRELEGIVPGRKSPHVLRHTLATELLDDGTDLNSIKELLGHSSLAATQVYTHNSIEKLRQVYNTAHPRAKTGEDYGNQD